MTHYALANLATEQGDRAALLVEGRYYRIDLLDGDLSQGGLFDLLDDWPRIRTALDLLAGRCETERHAIVAAPRLIAPIRFPRKLICVGAVYSDHLQQFDLPPERWPSMPIFLRPPTTSIVGPGRNVRIPAMTLQFDWEIELAVVMGDHLSGGSEAQARDAIAGYSVGIDFTCRDLLDRGSQVGVDLVRAKAQDTMAPMGPVLMPAQFIDDPQDLALRLHVNGEMRQNGNTSNMLFSIYEQVSVISRFITLEPGDVIFTGSPAGSARSDDQFLRPGDRVHAEIEQIGILEIELFSDLVDAAPGEAAHV